MFALIYSWELENNEHFWLQTHLELDLVQVELGVSHETLTQSWVTCLTNLM